MQSKIFGSLTSFFASVERETSVHWSHGLLLRIII